MPGVAGREREMIAVGWKVIQSVPMAFIQTGLQTGAMIAAAVEEVI